MSEVLVVAETADGVVAKPTLELLTLARRIGDPVALVLGPGAEDYAGRLGEYGAARVLAADDPALADYLVAPKADAVTAAVEAVQPATVLFT